jgi:hypothetical protein
MTKRTFTGDVIKQPRDNDMYFNVLWLQQASEENRYTWFNTHTPDERLVLQLGSSLRRWLSHQMPGPKSSDMAIIKMQRDREAFMHKLTVIDNDETITGSLNNPQLALIDACARVCSRNHPKSENETRVEMITRGQRIKHCTDECMTKNRGMVRTQEKGSPRTTKQTTKPQLPIADNAFKTEREISIANRTKLITNK